MVVLAAMAEALSIAMTDRMFIYFHRLRLLHTGVAKVPTVGRGCVAEIAKGVTVAEGATVAKGEKVLKGASVAKKVTVMASEDAVMIVDEAITTVDKSNALLQRCYHCFLTFRGRLPVSSHHTFYLLNWFNLF